MNGIEERDERRASERRMIGADGEDGDRAPGSLGVKRLRKAPAEVSLHLGFAPPRRAEYGHERRILRIGIRVQDRLPRAARVDPGGVFEERPIETRRSLEAEGAGESRLDPSRDGSAREEHQRTRLLRHVGIMSRPGLDPDYPVFFDSFGRTETKTFFVRYDVRFDTPSRRATASFCPPGTTSS